MPYVHLLEAVDGRGWNIGSSTIAGGTLTPQCRPGHSIAHSQRLSWFVLDHTLAALEIEQVRSFEEGICIRPKAA